MTTRGHTIFDAMSPPLNVARYQLSAAVSAPGSCIFTTASRGQVRRSSTALRANSFSSAPLAMNTEM